MWPFDQNNQQMYQQYANSWNQGTYGQLPEQEARQNYNQFVQNAPPQMIEQAHQQYYQQMPQQQRGNLMQSLIGTLTQQGYNPQQAGIPTNNPYNMSPQDAARLTSYAQQQNPDILHQIMGPGGPLGSTGAKLAVAGIAAIAAKQLLGGGGTGIKL
ncbi:MAG TPA: hypothetical protein VE843_00650 [Ktedonobacteraceae bacterium]|nr:hypothetical protein [Ktedonobacteraceae bacterium]